MSYKQLTYKDFDLDEFFERLRFDKRFQLDLGDIRLTLGQQDELVRIFNEMKEKIKELEK